MDQQEKQFKYDEIDLMDYVKVILKRKRMILIVSLIAIIVAGVFSWSSPKVYKIDTTLEIGRIGIRAIEAPKQVAEKINDRVYGWISGIKINNPANTNLIKIEAISREPQETKKILEDINELILADHNNNKINAQKNLLENDIERLKTTIGSLEEEKTNLKAQIEILQKIPPEEQTPASQFVLFSTRGELEEKKQDIEDLYLQINSLQRLLEDIQLTKIIKIPIISERLVKPRLLLNIVVAAVLGIFIGLFLAFFQEWWKKNKVKP